MVKVECSKLGDRRRELDSVWDGLPPSIPEETPDNAEICEEKSAGSSFAESLISRNVDSDCEELFASSSSYPRWQIQ